MPKATIKLKGGAVVTVEGSVSEVAEIASRLKTNHAQKQVLEKHNTKKVQKKKLAASGFIIELREAGFLNKAKGLSEIAAALEEKGHLYPLTTLSGVVLDLVRARQLGRKKVDGRWVYGRR
jgi:hypothetical protein